MAGWVKLHRCLREKAIFQNEKLLKVFIWCLLKATHSEHEQLVGRQKVALKPGQFVTGRKKAGTELDMAPSTAWSYLKLLDDNNTIDIKSNNKFSVITVVNWEVYQSDDRKSDSKYNSYTDNKQTADEQQMDTNKNGKNVKNDKEDIYILTENKERFLNTLSQVENYPLDRNKDLEMYKALANRYPKLDLNEAIEQWRVYKLDKPLTEKSNPRSQINMAFKKYLEWGKCLKGGINNGGSADQRNTGRDDGSWGESIQNSKLFTRKLG